MLEKYILAQTVHKLGKIQKKIAEERLNIVRGNFSDMEDSSWLACQNTPYFNELYNLAFGLCKEIKSLRKKIDKRMIEKCV